MQECGELGRVSRGEGAMRLVSSGLAALLVVLVLASCGLVSPEPSDTLYVKTYEKADDRMEQIAAAVSDGDAAALRAMFSTRALDQAVEIDGALDQLLSSFPNGGLTWELWESPRAERQYKDGKLTEVLLALYRVSADGRDYALFLAEFTVNEVINPDNVGLYALGVVPWTDQPSYGCAEPFYSLACAIHADESDAEGYPGVYVPE